MSLLEFDPPDRFVAGTVGPPGQRTFFLQASEGPRVTSVSLEKQQVVVLADRNVDAASIKVETLNGTVMLSGFAKNSLEKSTAENIARDTKGVKSVRNEIAVRP